MSATTKIEWCDATWNPVTGCTPCSPGCDHCYAQEMARRFPQLHGTNAAGDPQPWEFPRLHPQRLDQPLQWRKPRRIFVCSMGDLFHENVPEKWRYEVFVRMAQCRHHTFLCLTKRPQAMLDYCSRFWPSLNDMCDGKAQYLPNVWLGVTVCNQAEADAKIPVLLQTPAAMRFVSVEPMLGPVDLRGLGLRCERIGQACGHAKRHPGCRMGNCLGYAGLEWVICGGETGPGARQMWHNWATDLRDQCAAAGVPYFYKGMGTARLPKGDPLYHLLDGREWRQFPEVHL